MNYLKKKRQKSRIFWINGINGPCNNFGKFWNLPMTLQYKPINLYKSKLEYFIVLRRKLVNRNFWLLCSVLSLFEYPWGWLNYLRCIYQYLIYFIINLLLRTGTFTANTNIKIRFFNAKTMLNSLLSLFAIDLFECILPIISRNIFVISARSLTNHHLYVIMPS